MSRAAGSAPFPAKHSNCSPDVDWNQQQTHLLPRGPKGRAKVFGLLRKMPVLTPLSPICVTNSPRSFLFTLFLNTDPFTSR